MSIVIMRSSSVALTNEFLFHKFLYIYISISLILGFYVDGFLIIGLLCPTAVCPFKIIGLSSKFSHDI